MKTSLADFVATMQQQEYFDPDAGAIFSVIYAQRWEEPNETNPLLLAVKYAYFKMFLKDDVLWARFKDLRFALDQKTFVPRAGDKIQLLSRIGYSEPLY